jgi:hypothetical protein
VEVTSEARGYYAYLQQVTDGGTNNFITVNIIKMAGVEYKEEKKEW